MRHRLFNFFILLLGIFLSLNSCSPSKDQKVSSIDLPTNVLDFTGTPTSPKDRSSLAFSDQGAWFAYGFPDQIEQTLGFSGPFLMGRGQGEWSSKALSQLELINKKTGKKLTLKNSLLTQTSYNSHLEQILENNELSIKQELFFNSAHSAIITTEINNSSNKTIELSPLWRGTTFSNLFELTNDENTVTLLSEGNTTKGIIQCFNHEVADIKLNDSSYVLTLNTIKVKPSETCVLTITHTFIFPEFDAKKELKQLEIDAKNPVKRLDLRIAEKQEQLAALTEKMDHHWQGDDYENLLAKTVLTLQNNTRIGVGELKHRGVFPSYHYEWFLGFWAWDSWKHASAIAQYDVELAKDQVRAMYDFQRDDGFILDCIYRDTTIENHNYRNTKPPLSAWAVWNIYECDGDIDFIKEMYPKIVNQHNWWYQYRDYDKDSICEYGSTDGTLVAAKWESGMDNAVRFDKSEMVKSTETVFSLNQESVDLNSYLHVEKQYLAKMAEVLNAKKDMNDFRVQAEVLKRKIQHQFFDKETGWFYDTSMDGNHFIKVMGCEGWLPLWAQTATEEQAEAVKNNMIDPKLFNTKVPFQTLSASHSDFKPNGGYWRGPNWLDQAYFGVIGLHNYGYHEDAYSASSKLMRNAEGLLEKGGSIRENYDPITGKGLEAQNFSWSAAHYLLLLLYENKAVN